MGVDSVMLIHGSGPIGDKIEARASGDRARTRRLIAVAIGARSTDDSEGWTRVAERIAALAPNFATLLRFMRREPALLSAYFAVEDHVCPLIERGGPAVRVLVRYAHDLAAGRAPSIAGLTEDERLRARLYELSLLAGAQEPSTIAVAAELLWLRTPSGLSALVFLLLKLGHASAHRLPLSLIVDWPEERRRVFFWRYLAFTFHRRLAPYADPAQTFRLILDPEEKARVTRLQMPGQFAAAKRSGFQLLRSIVRRAGHTPTRWFDMSLTLPRLANLTRAHD